MSAPLSLASVIDDLEKRQHGDPHEVVSIANVLADLRSVAAVTPAAVEALREARKALHCLHIAVEPGIANDVHAAVEAAFSALLAADPDPQERVIELLRKIASGKGAYRVDRAEHHVNIIEESMAAAREALELLGVELEKESQP